MFPVYNEGRKAIKAEKLRKLGCLLCPKVTHSDENNWRCWKEKPTQPSKVYSLDRTTKIRTECLQKWEKISILPQRKELLKITWKGLIKTLWRQSRERPTKMIKGMEGKSCVERLKEVELFISVKKRRVRSNLIKGPCMWKMLTSSSLCPKKAK